MTQQEAFELSLKEDKKITHRFFSSHEWMKLLTDNIILTEDGYKTHKDEFMRWRKGEEWQDGWSLFKEN